MFDGSAIAGWRDVSQSDMLLKPDLESAVLDPFSAQPSLILIADVAEPSTGLGYERCPRSVAERAEAHLAATRLADERADRAAGRVLRVRRRALRRSPCRRASGGSMPRRGRTTRAPATRSATAATGRRAARRSPCRRSTRWRICAPRWRRCSARWGSRRCCHHHDTAPGQHELSLGFGGLRASADRLQIYKYVVHNVANSYGKTATFLPKPMAFQPGSGLQIQQALWREGRPVFAGQGYADLSELCLHYIGGILHHARALNAFTNPTTNSYRRLVAGRRRAAPAGLRRAQPLGRDPPAVRRPARGQAGRGALRRSGRQPLPRVRRAADGRARRHRPPDRPGRGDGPQPLRPAARGPRRAADGLRDARRGARRARSRPRAS